MAQVEGENGKTRNCLESRPPARDEWLAEKGATQERAKLNIFSSYTDFKKLKLIFYLN